MPSWLQEYCCARQWLAAAAFLSFVVSASDGRAQEPAAYPKQSPATTYGTVADLKVWKTVTLGTRKGVDGYRAALERAAIKIGDSADEILGRPAFSYSTTKTEVELVVLSVAQLGVEAEAEPLASVYQRARRIGLDLCPAEVGPQLRLDYLTQPLSEALDIAMEPVATYSGDLTVLTLVNFGSGLALIGGDGRSHSMVPRTRRFVFALPAKGRLEARRGPQ
jgi:hypothetical protein